MYVNGQYSRDMIPQLTQQLAMRAESLAPVVPWTDPVSSTIPSTRHELDIPIQGHCNTDVAFGKEVHISLKDWQDKLTDTGTAWFLSKIIVEVTVPAIRHHSEKFRANDRFICDHNCTEKTRCHHRPTLPPPVYWKNCLGHWIGAHCARLSINGVVPFATTWYQQEIMDDLTNPRCQSTDEEIGRFLMESEQMAWSRSQPYLSVTSTLLMTPFQQQIMGIPLFLLINSPMTLKLSIPPLNTCYYTNDPKSMPELLFANRKIKDTDISIRLFAECLQTQDLRFYGGQQQVLNKEIQYYWPYFQNFRGRITKSALDEYKKEHRKHEAVIEIPIRREILEILWFVQPIGVHKIESEFHWGGLGDDDAFTHASISIGDQTVLSERTAKYLRKNVYRNVHVNKPMHYVYGWSWSPTPDRSDVNTSAFLVPEPDTHNSRFKSLQICMKLQPYVHALNWYVLIRRPNIGSILNGKLSLASEVPKEESL